MRPPSHLAVDLAQIDDVDAITQILIEWGREVAADAKALALIGFTEDRMWDGNPLMHTQTRLVGPWRLAPKDTA